MTRARVSPNVDAHAAAIHACEVGSASLEVQKRSGGKTVETSGLQLTERRSAIEAAGCKVRLAQTNCQARWVNSDRQLADGLTKPDACDHVRKVQRQGFWKSVFDPEFVSVKKKRKELIQAIIKKRTEQKQWTQAQADQEILPDA